jgi:uncharacterized membrane protein
MMAGDLTASSTIAVSEPNVAAAAPQQLARRARRTIPIHLSWAGIAAGAMTAAAAAGFSAISLYRFNHFAANGFDLGIQDQTVWGYSQLQIIPNTVLGIPNLLGDHFHPILMVLAPLHLLWDSAGVLLVAQGILLAVAGIPIYLWASQRLGRVAGLAFQASYLSFWGVLAGVVFDFHHIVFAVPAVATALYATVNRRNRLLWAMVAVAMLTREDVALTVIALGLYILVVQRRVVLGAVLMGINAVWFVLLLDVVMPALSGSAYQHWTYQALGKGPLSAAAYVLEHPIKSLELLGTPIQKLRVGAGTFASWMLLPLLSPLTLVAIPSFLERFWSSSASLWSFHFQYSMLPAPILAFAAIDGAARLRSWSRGRWASAATIVLPIGALATSAILSFGVVDSLAELGTYVPDSTAAQIQGCLDVIPAGASVAATDPLVPHLTNRRAIYEVTTFSDADYIAVDISTAGTVNSPDDQLRTIVREALAEGYGVACSRGYTAVLARAVPGGDLSPEMWQWLAGDCDGRGCLAAR